MVRGNYGEHSKDVVEKEVRKEIQKQIDEALTWDDYHCPEPIRRYKIGLKTTIWRKDEPQLPQDSNATRSTGRSRINEGMEKDGQ